MLSIEKGVDYDGVEGELPYKHVRNLGFGHSGNVEEVEDQMTGQVYARKTIRITGTKRDKAERTRVFRNEVAIIRGLESHRHIISVHATYATTRVFGILLEPVASQGDLGDFLSDYSREMEEEATIPNVRTAAMKPVIKQGFGCLAAGLAFMHQRRIRHKDIKPRNIIVHMGKLIYTDFGYSFDSNGFSRSTTEGRPDYFTRRYSAPEVLKHDQRNSKSDVYSLGCVFLDMLSTLCPSLIVDKDECFSNTMQQLHSQLQDIEAPKDLDVLTDIISCMTAQEGSSRLCSMHAAIPLLQQIETCCSDCVGSPLQEENERVKRDNCFLCQGGKMKTTATIYTGRSGTNLADVNYHSSYEWVLKKWKRLRYNNTMSQWEFSDYYDGPPPNSRSGGHLLEGTYNPQNPAMALHYEILDSSYHAHHRDFFQEGRLFSVLFTEPAGANAIRNNAVTDYNSALSHVLLGGRSYIQRRRFIVVRNRKAFCYAIPIFTYHGQGTLKSGVAPQEHAIAYSYGTTPQLLPAEEPLSKGPICIVTNKGERSLSQASRIFFGIHHPIQYNAKVKDLGYVHPNELPRFLDYWAMDHNVETHQAQEVTMEADNARSRAISYNSSSGGKCNR
ncbi:hypothetical protein HBH56_018300 [Parastagonospora nodorum]|uniref:Protein kinase domain-containing protein n=1 Tax=Phaeosphaeria nodorum (strain SN15 / ATCC MYA-4574 / FGSC 10173) TaxID=321614 RepID=A0A7U2EY67_PHANO|nr:hypothetical protein HBH56_018300 [Parastagonospora nodorum]QRC95258.1 hypothetical protein JI435_029570 [Parastagonospora nodorum SN15]KAH3937313.1 hypothetical protein HBH54_016190 [Parastagonospora nodorum]KAH3990606.1 hypothetical protein HBH52_005110 [Parastagonospora nodorum]KAH4137308.1 hypothetical protein HBH45_124610 [Parastagonospora nodorum]